jgi:hypothetical protein
MIVLFSLKRLLGIGKKPGKVHSVTKHLLLVNTSAGSDGIDWRAFLEVTYLVSQGC